MKIRAWCVAVVAVSLLFTAAEAGKLERCIERCEKNHGRPTPTPTPTPVPLPCEPMGTKTFAGRGDEKLLCFPMAAGAGFVEVSSRNHGNASCASVEMEVTTPSGQKAYSYGVQPNVITMPREAGRYYVWTRFLYDDASDACRTYSFTVR